MAGTPLAGTNGRITFGGVNANLSKWQCRFTANDLPTTNFESFAADGFTYEEGVTGVRSCSVTVEGFWDAGANPHSTFNLVAGSIITTMHLYLNRTGSRRVEFASFRVLEVSDANEVNGLVTFTMSGKGNGVFVYPV